MATTPGDTPSIQQTASGTWIQMVGGADLNDASVQGYLKWMRNRYRYTNPGGADAGWGSSHWYYMWSSSKAFLFLRGANTAPAAGNIGVDDIGVLPAASAPCVRRATGCTVIRWRTRASASSAAMARATMAVQPQADFYYDFAYTILGYQCADGSYACNSAPGYWNQYCAPAPGCAAWCCSGRSVAAAWTLNKDGKCDVGDSPAPPQVGEWRC